MLNFGIKDLIDILLVAFLLYYVWRLMKESSSANLFTGILIFVVGWILVARVFEMRLMGSILDNLINIGAVALVVLFQDEIRQFLSTIGSRKNMRLLSRILKAPDKPENYHNELMPVVMACMSMSKQKVGALIVVTRSVALKDIIATGDPINADINQRLIENIFFKNSPLHDGAMIISKGRIAAAGCILPVSHDSDIPKALGLRHRAALGISQKSDCLAIVVSEETGGISVTENGQLRMRLTAEQLESILTENWEH